MTSSLPSSRLTLDCSSRETALDSVAAVLSLGQSQLMSVISTIDLDVECDKPDYLGDPNRTLWDAVLLAAGLPTPRPVDEVRWFHLTRVPMGTAFDEGILPLSGSLDRIWAMLLSVFAGTHHHKQLEVLRAKGVYNFQYQLKVGVDLHAGPYAMLVRESAFRWKEMGAHDYLGMPEIAQDICGGYLEAFHEDIEPDLRAALTPCIVSFRSRQCRRVHLEAALRYLYTTHHGDGFTFYSNHVFDGQNARVPRSDVIAIEYVR